MLDLGMVLAGDPDAAEAWTAEQRVKARAWHAVRTSGLTGPPSVSALTLRDLSVWFGQLLEHGKGLARIFHHGAVSVVKGSR